MAAGGLGSARTEKGIQSTCHIGANAESNGCFHTKERTGNGKCPKGVKDGLPGVTGRISYADTADDTDVWIEPGRQGVI